MANQDHKAKGFPGADLALPGLFLAIFAVYGYLFFEANLESARPGMGDGSSPPPRSASSIPGVYSRLWQDPLAASYQAQKLEGSWWEKQLQRSIRDGSQDERLKDMQDRLATIIPKHGQDRLIVMPVLLPGGPYDHDKETRLRTRYAVLAGLHCRGYTLAYPERMSYIELPVTVHVPLKSTKPQQEKIIVPLKLFKVADEGAEDKREPVLVLWINEDQLGLQPLSTLAQIIDQSFPKAPPRRLALRMIGPTDSDMLLNMAEEDEAYKKGARSVPKELRGYWLNSRYFSTRYHEPRIYSPYATTNDVSPFISGTAPGFTGIQVVRTIGGDEELIDALGSEILLRTGLIRKKDEGTIKAKKNKIVLIAEEDTSYGRSFHKLLQDKISSVTALVSEPQLYSYLRGLDGNVPNDADGQSARDSKKDARGEGRDAEDGTVGRSQLDYLRRLEHRIVNESRREPARVVAVGIIGTDVYDKLLILRALRKKFPSTWFFTTDLDARLMDKQEYPYARNLIVASHFGFQLHPDHQADIPPFRDGYQTACFLAVQLALGDQIDLGENTELLQRDPWGLHSESATNRLKPLVFEVIRDGAYQLTMTEGEKGLTAALQPRSPRETRWVRWGFVAPAIALLAICLCLQLTRFRQVTLYALGSFRRLTAVANYRTLRNRAETSEAKRRLLRGMARDCLLVASLVFTGCLIGAIARDHGWNADGEPFLLAAGISVWPATLLRYAALIAGAGLLYYGYLDLRRSERHLRKNYHLGDAECSAQWPEGDRWKCDWWIELLVPRAKFGETDGSCQQLWNEYTRRGHWKRRAVRVLSMTAGYIAFALLLFLATEFPNLPHRGGFSSWVPFSILVVAVPATLALSFFVLDAVQMCGWFVKELSSKENLIWPHYEHSDVAIRERMTVELIADRTLAVGKLLRYPFAV